MSRGKRRRGSLLHKFSNAKGFLRVPNQLSTVRGIRCPIAKVPSPRARRVPPPIARRCARLSEAGRSESEEHRCLRQVAALGPPRTPVGDVFGPSSPAR